MRAATQVTLSIKYQNGKLMRAQSGVHEHEEILIGGRLTQRVVRVGNTIRRPSTDVSGFVAKLLNHLESAGFASAPKYLGQDERGRDMLSYISGWVPAKFQYFTDDQIVEAGRLLRRFHDATRGSPLVSGASVVCHHDVGPNNVVFQNGRPFAFIDFDMAAPGPALDDVGYMAWT
jgi:Ser/Thr protein kinase RdoA (MazF antagonist)